MNEEPLLIKGYKTMHIPEHKKIVSINSNKTKQIIIAKYRENLKWVNLLFNIPYIIYDKYKKKSPHHLPNIPTFNIHQFEGVRYTKSPTGRESHTYLYHIIKHYHELADINIFLQGRPFETDHSALDPLRVLFQKDFEGVNFLPLTFPVCICDKRAAPFHFGIPLERVFKRLFKSPCPDYFAYGWGAMFCVTKEYIHKRPLIFYEEMMQIVYEEPLSGYVYERMWPTILACHGFQHHDHFPKPNRAAWGMPNL